jgi:hypothetical protein
MAVNRNQAGLNMNHRICLVTQDSTRKCLMDLGALRSVGFARDLRSDGAVIDSWGGAGGQLQLPRCPFADTKKKNAVEFGFPPQPKEIS